MAQLQKFASTHPHRHAHPRLPPDQNRWNRSNPPLDGVGPGASVKIRSLNAMVSSAGTRTPGLRNSTARQELTPKANPATSVLQCMFHSPQRFLDCLCPLCWQGQQNLTRVDHVRTQKRKVAGRGITPQLTISFCSEKWCRLRDSNTRPSHYECDALPAELRRPRRLFSARRDGGQEQRRAGGRARR